MTSSDSKTPVILLVEDDLADQDLTTAAIEEVDMGADVRVASDGVEAMEYLLRQGQYADATAHPMPDILILDLNMPKLDGRGVLASIKENPALCHIPVVVMTTSGQEEDVNHSYELGCNSFVSKPVDMIDYFATIQSICDYWFKLAKLPAIAG